MVGNDAAAMALTLEAEAQQRRIGGRALLGKCLTLRAGLIARRGDPGAARVVTRGDRDLYQLQRRVAKVVDHVMRRRMLYGVPIHREITAEWQAHLGRAPPAIVDRT